MSEAESKTPAESEPEALRRLIGDAPREVPILPMRASVLFPRALIPVTIGRAPSLEAIKDAMSRDRIVAVFMQRDPAIEAPGAGDLHEVGTLALIIKMIRADEDNVHALVQGITRCRLDGITSAEPFLRGVVTPLADEAASEPADPEVSALAQEALAQLERLLTIMPELPRDVLEVARGLPSPAHLADFLASLVELDADERQALLAEGSTGVRLRRLLPALERQIHVLVVGKEIREEVKKSFDDRQRQAILREQLEAIQRQLGEDEGGKRELEELRARLAAAGLPDEARKEADRELGRLARIPPQSNEHSVIRTYLEWLADLPWSVSTEDETDLARARTILDEDHSGLEAIKERILEFLAIRTLRSDARTPILCLSGPPGTGKTSLGRSIARALGRNFVRQSMGGVHDEAEIRGHRRTYVGAMPGKLIQALRRAGSNNPVILLDEVDKVGRDSRGDPTAALLEVLDPEQNRNFVDHYLGVAFDLSRVFFICTVNVLEQVPPPLRDRMEVIELSGYTEREKLAIARQHLLPRVIADNAADALGLTMRDEAIQRVIRGYTREAGLRTLERRLASLVRKTAKALAEGVDAPREIDAARVRELLGPDRYLDQDIPRIDEPGGALGLAWTPVGGEVLVIEAAGMPGHKGFILTGQLGDVMKESATAALTYLRSHAESLGIDPERFARTEIHLHVPAGAIPKDGPSAGTAICTALASLFTGRLPTPGVAMTGEITLKGRVLPVGGIKEKVLGAHRAGLRMVLLPRDNAGDLEELPAEVRESMEIRLCGRMEEVLQHSLMPAEPAG
ncbi:MAG: endopeptidase La [Myxococcales bacterium]|nr:endopeptidase La [Myxococcales bacterium]